MNRLNKNIIFETEMNKLLKNCYTARKTSSFITHVSMGKIMGRYNFNQDNMSELFNLCATYRGTEGICEMPQYYSMLRFDFDFEETGTVIRPLFDINIFLNDIIKKIQIYLEQNIIDFKPEQADCCILTKDPYIKTQNNKTSIKHGLHLQFPNTFVSKDDFKIIEKKFKDLTNFFGMDTGMASKPWLLYNQSKGEGKGTYTANCVLTHNGFILEPENYFENYKLYCKGKLIKFNKDIEHYYPRIFSILPINRDDMSVEMKHMKTVVYSNSTTKQSTIWDDCDDQINEFEDEISNIVQTYIDEQLEGCYDISDWDCNNFLQLKRNKTFICPTTNSREHDNLGAYISINNKNGKVYMGCHCNEGKAFPIGTFKITESDLESELENKYDYLQQLNEKKIDQLIYTSGYIEKNDRWVLPDILERNKCIVVKAGLGKGKTTASVHHINNNKYDRIIVLTPRRTFAKSVCNRLNAECKNVTFEMYSNLKGKNYIIKNKFIVIQVESLNRLELNENDKTLLLCDEVESVLFQMTVDKTHGKKHIYNLNMLERLFKTATKIICLDAFISNKTLTTLRLMNIPYTYYNYTLPLEDRKCVKIDKKNNFLNKLLLDLGQNKKVFLFSTSNKALTNDFIPKIKSKFPNKKVIEYHSKFTSIDLTNVNENWKNADVIACTSTITVGCNFDLKDIFNKVYVYANASSKNLVRDIFQATYRIRHIKDKEMIYSIDKRHTDLIYQQIKKKLKQI
jgi:hypothetical protein